MTEKGRNIISPQPPPPLRPFICSFATCARIPTDYPEYPSSRRRRSICPLDVLPKVQSGREDICEQYLLCPVMRVYLLPPVMHAADCRRGLAQGVPAGRALMHGRIKYMVQFIFVQLLNVQSDFCSIFEMFN